MKNKLLILLLAGVAACDSATEAEIRDRANEYPVRASWSAAAAPVGTSTVSAQIQAKEYAGSRIEATITLNGGVANGAYQWRIFRGDCTVNTPAANNTAPTGLLLFSTVQSYPEITTGATGTGTVTRTIAGSLDADTKYSVRVRVSQQSTSWNGTNPIACGNLQRS